MNNLLLFREISGVQRKEISFFLHTSIHVYHYYEKDIITIPENIKRMLAKLYDVTETELFNSDGVISENTMEKLRYFSTLDEEKRKKKLSLNLPTSNLLAKPSIYVFTATFGSLEIPRVFAKSLVEPQGR